MLPVWSRMIESLPKHDAISLAAEAWFGTFFLLLCDLLQWYLKNGIEISAFCNLQLTDTCINTSSYCSFIAYMQVLPHLKTRMDYFMISLLYKNNSDDADRNKRLNF